MITYVPEKPCKRGHRLRYKANGACVECNTLAVVAWQRKNREKVNAYMRGWSSKNREKATKSTQKWRETNKAKVAAVSRSWRAKNPGKKRLQTLKERLHKAQVTPKWLTADEFFLIEEAYELAALRTAMFGFSWHVDHIVPLRGKTVSGLHVPWNLRVIPAAQNLRKYNHLEAT